MFKKLSIALALIAMASVAGAMTLTADGFTASGTADINYAGDRIGLINDGSFESGACEVVWNCHTDTTCEDRILDPLSIWGYPAYDGMYCAWVGGFCGGIPSSNGLCQDILFDGGELSFYWMGYVEYGGSNSVVVTVDGAYVWEVVLQLEHHTYGIWSNTGDAGGLGNADVGAYVGGTHSLCFEFVATDGANMLIDYVEMLGTTAAEDMDFSSVKALY